MLRIIVLRIPVCVPLLMAWVSIQVCGVLLESNATTSSATNILVEDERGEDFGECPAYDESLAEGKQCPNDISANSYIGTSWMGLAILLLSVAGYWAYSQRKAQAELQNNRTSKHRSIRSDDGMEILRTTRDRASTFDFFGAHNNNCKNRHANNPSDAAKHNMRERRGSIVSMVSDLSGGEMRRERLGSMDLFYSQRDLPGDESKKKQKLKSKTNFQPKMEAKNKDKKRSRALSNSTVPSTGGEMPNGEFLLQHTLSTGSIQGEEGRSQDDDGYLFDEFGLVTLSYEMSYYGPAHTALTFDTWTPPTSLAEVSRRIIPQDIMLKLRRKILLDMNEARVTIQEPKSSERWNFAFPAEDLSIHVETPAEAAVINIYERGSSREDWMEHTFESAQMAAQFQLDLLAYQVTGKTINNIFQALCLIHFGSQAYDGQEYVLHYLMDAASNKSNGDKDAPEPLQKTPMSAVAWDDAMRALSSIPTIRIALERLWLHQCRKGAFVSRSSMSVVNEKGAESSTGDGDCGGLLNDEYTDKRLLLGPVDFFRLFVPALPEMAIPMTESNRSRMEQILSWTKRAARAAVLVRSYVKSREVANLGWVVEPESGLTVNNPPRKLKRRLAFDGNEDNSRHDSIARDEFYEASVSRDVLCHVRPYDYFSRKNERKDGREEQALVLSPYQGYSLIGGHVFRKPKTDAADVSLDPSRDPVEAIPSLASLIASNPDLDFLVTSWHRKDTLSVFLYARSLAKGIDPQFDRVMVRFSNANKAERDKRLHMMIQMGQSLSLSFLGVLLLRFLNFLFSLTRKGRESALSLQARRDRVPFPAIRISSYGQTYHFGGAMQGNETLPQNYVGIGVALSPRSMPNFVSRFMFSYLDDQISERVLDITLVLEGQQEDELPERALCTTRIVRVDADAVATATTTAVEPSAKDMHPNLDPTDLAEGSGMWPRRLADDFAAVVQDNLSHLVIGSGKSKAYESPRMPFEEAERSHRYGCLPRQQSLVNQPSMDSVIDSVVSLLTGVNVPKKPNLSSLVQEDMLRNFVLTPVLDVLQPEDVKQIIIASGFDIQKAAVRTVQVAAYRGWMFPVDIRQCRIELQSGQCFQQGKDRFGNPVFYFMTTRRGPWRDDYNATLLAALHRIESRESGLSAFPPDTTVTLVIQLGRAKLPNELHRDMDENGIEHTEGERTESHGSTEESPMESTVIESVSNNDDIHIVNNPRVSEEEKWQLHSTRKLLEELIAIMFFHHPGRVSNVIFLRGDGPDVLYKSKVAVGRAMKRCIESPGARSKVRFLRRLSNLKEYIDGDVISAAVGGPAPVPESAFTFG